MFLAQALRRRRGPSSTTRTRSLTPAPTESIASSVAPVATPCGVSGLHEQQLGALELRTLLTRDDGANNPPKNHLCLIGVNLWLSDRWLSWSV